MSPGDAEYCLVSLTGVFVSEFPDGVLPSLCLLGAGLAVGNMLIMQGPTSPSRGMEVAAVAAIGNDLPSTKTAVVSKAKPEPANVPLAAKPPVPPKGEDVTGSVKQTKRPDQKQSAQADSKLRAKTAPGKDTLSTKTQVASKAKAKAANAPVPAAEDVTGAVKQPNKTDQKQSAQAEPKLRNDPNLVEPAPPGPYARPYRPRRYGWRWYYGYPPPRFAIRVYPGW